MPYDSVAQLPPHVKKYTDKVQRQWRYVFNSVYDKVLKETNDKSQAETRAFKAANAILSKRFVGKESMIKNTRSDYFNFLIDKWLGNLR
jgi:cation transport regulator ChaB